MTRNVIVPLTWYAEGPKGEDCGHRHRSPDAAGRCALKSERKAVRSSDGAKLRVGYAMTEDDTSMVPVLVDRSSGEVHGIYVGLYLQRLPSQFLSPASL